VRGSGSAASSLTSASDLHNPERLLITSREPSQRTVLGVNWRSFILLGVNLLRSFEDVSFDSSRDSGTLVESVAGIGSMLIVASFSSG